MMNEKLSWILGITAILTTALALLVILPSVKADADSQPVLAPELPGQFTYQGQLLDPDTENPVPDGKYDMLFTIYDDPSFGAILWEQYYYGVNGIPVKSGQFTVYLGNALNPIQADILDGEPRWLGVKVGTDPEMSPRTPLTSVPYALRAETLRAGGVTSDTLASALYTFGNPSPSGYALLAQGNVEIQGELTWSTRTGYLSIPAAAFEPGADTFNYHNNGSNLYTDSGANYFAPVNLPNGSTVTDVTFYYYDDVTAGSVTVNLNRYDLDSHIVNTMASVSSATVGYGDGHDDSVSYAQVDNQEYSYYLYAVFGSTGIDLKLHVVTIEYEYEEPY